MNGSYAGEQTALSADDVTHFQSVYGQTPEPGTWLILGLSATLLAIGRAIRQRNLDSVRRVPVTGHDGQSHVC